MGHKDRDYYRRRVAQETAAAQCSSCDHARAVHRDLAERYSAKLRLAEALTSETSFEEPQNLAARGTRIGPADT